MGRYIYLYCFLVKCEVRSLILLVKPDDFFAFCFGSDARKAVNHLFLGSEAGESRPECVLMLGALTSEEKTQCRKFVQRICYYC